ncbi:PREDICTED: uncharacterized protein LOC109333899 [Lupinus angustifolius]|uniref:uncharacterized protein LOC109333899 n=1 Tax=Lupinus angustifolius TaxID=3871 RepID=UPI00092EE886|nr:PREDICTED: uncharacterized protein LOC109333899 [Lupinus angustifolius]
MESEWNHITTEKEKESIKRYLEAELCYMPSNNFYSHPHNLTIRNLAVSIIAKHWRGVEIDAFVPYLAMNYFDTLVSHYEEKPYSEIDQVPLVATACLNIAAKIRKFSDDFYLKDFDPDAIKEVELRIRNNLEGLTKPVTPFCFLDHFYPPFQRIGGFKRRCINEIIVQAKGEDDFIEYKPSDIAFHSFVAASCIAKLMMGLSSAKIPVCGIMDY